VARTEVDPATHQEYDAGFYAAGEMSDAKLKELSERLLVLEGQLSTADDNAPPIYRIMSHNPDATPRTAWGLKRMKKRYDREMAAARIRADYQSQPLG
jgi:hypothetical protein